MEMARQCTSGKLPVRGMEIIVFLLVEVVRVFFFFLWEELDVDAADGVVDES